MPVSAPEHRDTIHVYVDPDVKLKLVNQAARAGATMSALVQSLLDLVLPLDPYNLSEHEEIVLTARTIDHERRTRRRQPKEPQQ